MTEVRACGSASLMSELYFGYGSNLERDDFERWCERKEFGDGHLDDVVGVAALNDWALVFGRFSRGRNGGVLDVWPRLGYAVPGVLFEVDEEGFEALDAKEGAPAVYRREKVIVEYAGRDVEAWTYVVASPSQKVYAPALGYVDIVRLGYERYGLDGAVLEAAAKGAREGVIGPPVSASLFVYGTLQGGERLSNYIDELKPVSITLATLTGRLFDLGTYPGLALDGDVAIQGECLTFRDISEALRVLDRVEGFEGYGERNNLYVRRLVTIGGEPTWTYLYVGGDEGIPIPHGDWQRWRTR